MLNFLKISIKKIIFILSSLYIIKYLFLIYTSVSKDNISKLNYKNIDYYFLNKNLITNYRIKTFLTKEPETLRWIDNFTTNSIFWDVGANIGLYTVYAAKNKNCQIISFEPSLNNLNLLSKNIILNNIYQNVSIAPIALSNINSFEFLNSTSHFEGSAHSSFKHEIDQKGKKLYNFFKYRTMGFKADDFIEFYKLSPPKYLKIDVDGIEELILEGSLNLLKHIKEILIEVNNEIKQGNQIWKKFSE